SFIRQTDAEMIKLWQWHALEELEHKAVAYDVYEAIGNREIERRLAMPLVVSALLLPIVLSWTWLVLRDPQVTNLREHRRGLRLLLGREGFVTRIIPKMGVFWRPGFHPAKHDTRALVTEWREKLFGSEGLLRGQVRNREVLAPA
ncbi:MAG TPA: metal-dependent hydrolase, partial [Solimonas sp.]|nr:metal-dependent hydrolase [Solimonas sp.]